MKYTKDNPRISYQYDPRIDDDVMILSYDVFEKNSGWWVQPMPRDKYADKYEEVRRMLQDQQN